MEPTKEFPIAITADGSAWSYGVTYHYWDREKIRSTELMQRVSDDYLGSLGSSLVAIKDLYRSRDAAIEAGQKDLLAQIEALKLRVRKLESEKSAEGKSLKYRLLANW